MMITYEQLCEKLENKEPFTLSRYGDGEWNAVLQVRGGNCDGHEYLPEMCKELADVLRNRTANLPENYYFASHLVTTDYNREVIESWMNAHGVSIPWACSSDILHIPIKEGTIDRFKDALSDHRIVFVGPEYLKGVIGFDFYITVDDTNCYCNGDIVSSILNDIFVNEGSEFTVIFCSSMAANCWIDEIHEMFHTIIDAGSVFDYFAKNGNRSFIRKALAE